MRATVSSKDMITEITALLSIDMAECKLPSARATYYKLSGQLSGVIDYRTVVSPDNALRHTLGALQQVFVLEVDVTSPTKSVPAISL